jgi:hypothetical protein
MNTDPEECPVRLDQPVDGAEAEAFETGVQDAVPLEDPFPDQRDHHRRQEHRVEEDGTEEAAERDVLVEDERGDQREEHHEPDLEHDEPAGIVDGAPEQVAAAGVRIEVAAAVEQRGEVLGSDIGAFPEQDLVAAGDRIGEVQEDRDEGEEAEDQQVRQEEDPGEALDAKPLLQAEHRPFEEVEGGGIEPAAEAGESVHP